MSFAKQHDQDTLVDIAHAHEHIAERKRFRPALAEEAAARTHAPAFRAR